MLSNLLIYEGVHSRYLIFCNTIQHRNINCFSLFKAKFSKLILIRWYSFIPICPFKVKIRNKIAFVCNHTRLLELGHLLEANSGYTSRSGWPSRSTGQRYQGIQRLWRMDSKAERKRRCQRKDQLVNKKILFV